MPTQSEIDALKLKMQNAETAKNNAYSSMQSWCNLISTYKFKEVGTTLCSDKNRVYPSCGEEFEGDCCYSTSYSSQTCEGNKTTYNQRVADYDKAVEDYENARDDYENASGDYTQSNIDKGVARIEEEAKAIRTRYYVFGGIVIVLIVAGIFIWYKLKK